MESLTLLLLTLNLTGCATLSMPVDEDPLAIEEQAEREAEQAEDARKAKLLNREEN